MGQELSSTWYGTFLLEDGRPVRSARFPENVESVRERLRARRSGDLTAEEAALVQGLDRSARVSRDRRFSAVPGLEIAPTTGAGTPPPPAPLAAVWRDLLLEEAEAALRAAWDPSVHTEEAVRALSDLDEMLNALGERLTSWASRDAPEVEAGEGGPVKGLAQRLAEATPTSDDLFPGADPQVTAARAELARLYLETLRTRTALEASIEQAMPRSAPNLSALLGPALAARLVAQAGGLSRMARLPASTIQVLGAERAFFEHLRGRAPPPRHGLLFLHADLHSAPRKARGKLARALAGKVAIAARMDLQGAALRPELGQAFRTRRDAIRAARSPREGKRRSVLPLDGAAEDR